MQRNPRIARHTGCSALPARMRMVAIVALVLNRSLDMAKTLILLQLILCLAQAQQPAPNAQPGAARVQQVLAQLSAAMKGDKTALARLRTRAEQGNAEAQFLFGELYDRGLGVLKDSARASQWYRKAAEQGNAQAQNNLGWMYHNGQGVPEDPAQAAAWLHKAAEQGYWAAQCNLGWMYYYGQGVAKDLAQAVYWFSKASAQGSAYALA